MQIININNQDNKKQRLDKFLSEEISKTNPEISRARIQNLIMDKMVKSGGEIIVDCAYKIKANQEFEITIPDPISMEILPKEIAFEVIFEDENMLVINKPAGLTTHPGNGNYQDTLVNALLFHCGKSLSGIGGVMRPGIVHRLDKDTSGLMVVAKNDIAHQELAKQIEQRILKRNYLAICYGTPNPAIGTIDKNIARSKLNRLKMAVVKEGGRRAITNYQMKEIYQNGLFSLINCQLDTGRTHQIRVHLSSIGNSIIGDQSYGNRKKSLKGLDDDIKQIVNNFPRQALHSYKISFLHPISKKEMGFEIELPEDIRDLRVRLEN